MVNKCIVFFTLYSSSHSSQDVPDYLSDDKELQLFMADTYDPEWKPHWVSAFLPTPAIRHPSSSAPYPRA